MVSGENLKICAILFLGALHSGARADTDDTPNQVSHEIDGYVMPMGIGAYQTQADGGGARYGVRMSFTRPSKNVDLQLGSTWGGQHQDFDFSFRMFHIVKLSPAFKVYLGAGLSEAYSSTGIMNDNPKPFFVDSAFTPLVRFVFDTGYGWGFAVETGVDLVFSRYYMNASNYPGLAPSDSTLRPQFYLGFGIPIEAD